MIEKGRWASIGYTICHNRSRSVRVALARGASTSSCHRFLLAFLLGSILAPWLSGLLPHGNFPPRCPLATFGLVAPWQLLATLPHGNLAIWPWLATPLQLPNPTLPWPSCPLAPVSLAAPLQLLASLPRGNFSPRRPPGISLRPHRGRLANYRDFYAGLAAFCALPAAVWQLLAISMPA